LHHKISKNNVVFCYRDARYWRRALCAARFAIAYLCPSLMLYEDDLDNRLRRRLDYGRCLLMNMSRATISKPLCFLSIEFVTHPILSSLRLARLASIHHVVQHTYLDPKFRLQATHSLLVLIAHEADSTTNPLCCFCQMHMFSFASPNQFSLLRSTKSFAGSLIRCRTMCLMDGNHLLKQYWVVHLTAAVECRKLRRIYTVKNMK